MGEKIIALLDNGNAYLCYKRLTKFGVYVHTRPNGDVLYSGAILQEYRVR